MDVKLIVVSAKGGTQEIAVRRPRILGRARGIGIVIPHPMVSERHCLLFEHAGLLMIQDLNSEHGTFIGGRKIILAPLPPGTEFSVGPLTLRADYSYSGNLESLPKALYDEPEPEAVPAPAVQEPIAPAVTAAAPEPTAAPTTPPSAESHAHREGEASAEPSAAAPGASSFFGFDVNAGFPSVAPAVEPRGATASLSSSVSPPNAPVQPVAAAPPGATVGFSNSAAPPAPKVAAAPAQKPKPPMPPPLPQVAETPRPEAPDFGGFTGDVRRADEETPSQIAEAGLEIPGLNLDSMLSGPPPAQPHPPAKQKSGSFLDYFSKPVARRKRALRLAPDKIAPLTDATPTPPASPQPPAASAPPNGAAKQSPLPQFAPPAETPPPAEPVDDDLSSFFKNLG